MLKDATFKGGLINAVQIVSTAFIRSPLIIVIINSTYVHTFTFHEIFKNIILMGAPITINHKTCGLLKIIVLLLSIILYTHSAGRSLGSSCKQWFGE